MRLTSLDNARGLAVLLAMLSHAFIQFGAWELFAPHLKVVTRVATPTFLVLFGAMVQLVYMRRHRTRGWGVAADALVLRATMCFGMFALITAAAALTGKITPGAAVDAVLVLGSGRFGNILIMYVMLMAVVAVLLPLYARFGLPFALGLSAAAWVVSLALTNAGMLPEHHLVSRIVGTPGAFGPALLPALSLMTVGFVVARALEAARPRGAIFALFAVLAIPTALAVIAESPATFARGVAGPYRAENHPFYYLYGACTAVGVLLAFRLMEARVSWIDRSVLGLLGRCSLFAYGVGNIALNLLPTWHGSPVVGTAFAGLFLLGLVLATRDVSRGFPLTDRLTCGMARRVASAWDGGTRLAASAIMFSAHTVKRRLT